MLMRSTVGFICLLASVGCVADGDQYASDSANSARGGEYARQVCASCHGVEAGDVGSPNPLAPSFESLAMRSGMSRMTLSALLRTPHKTMPNLMVEPARIDDLAAYIESLGEGDDV